MFSRVIAICLREGKLWIQNQIYSPKKTDIVSHPACARTVVKYIRVWVIKSRIKGLNRK